MSTWIRLNHRDLTISRKGFADKLYVTCHSLYGWAGFQTKEYYEEHPGEKDQILVLIGKSPRDIMIEVGNYMRKVYSRTWIDNLLLGVKADILIIPDVRYHNEIMAIRALKGSVYKIRRPQIEDTEDQADSALTDFEDWDGVIENDGTLKEFHDKIISDVANVHFGI